MRYLRTSHVARILSGCLALSMLLTVLLPLCDVGDRMEESSFSSWLRSHIAVEHDETFEEAIEAAEQASPESLSDFLAAFVDAHPAPHELAARLGNHADMDLLLLLKGSSERLGGSAVIPRLAINASGVAGLSLDRLAHVPSLGQIPFPVLFTLPGTISADTGELLVFSFRLFSDAQPLGP